MVRMLILGTGSMAAQHAMALTALDNCDVVAGVDVSLERAQAFTAEHNIPNAFCDLEEAISWGEFDAVSNVTPDQVHYSTTLRLIEAGKPVLCEKPLAITYEQALEMTEAAEQAGLANMVNLRYRGLAPVQEAARLVRSGAIGEVRHVDAAYLQSWLIGTHWGDWRTEERWLWRLSEAHGSKGVLGDIGIHILDLASYVANEDVASVQCRLKCFSKAENDQIGDYILDANDSFVMSIGFENGALGTVQASRWMAGYENAQKLGVYGSLGSLEVTFEKEISKLRVCLGDDVNTQTWRDIECPDVPRIYELFVEAVRTGHNGQPNFRRATEIQRVLDLCFSSSEKGTTELIDR